MRERPLILIVDDSEFALNSVKRAYRCKYDFVSATEGKTAISEARKHKPDLILMDIMMPGGMDGIEAVKTIKRDKEISSIPIIMVTSIANHQAELSALMAGADDYVLKPFNCSILQIRIDRLLRQYDERRNQSQN